MTWVRTSAAIGLAVAVSVAGSACMTRSCRDFTCDRLTIRTESASSPSRIAWNGTEYPLSTASDRATALAGTCYGDLGYITPFIADAGAMDEAMPELTIDCFVNGTELLLEGNFDVAATADGITTVALQGWTAKPNEVPSSCILSTRASVDVTAASGGAAPLPQAVTGDFRRVLDVTVHATGCAEVDAQLHFDISAANFVGESNVTCQACQE